MESVATPEISELTYATDGESYLDDETRTHFTQEVTALRDLCTNAREDTENSWEGVREWLRNHTETEATMAAECRDERRMTSLHLACQNAPPLDIVELLLTASPETVKWDDVGGWLPLHYACANGASEEVIQRLVEAFSEGMTIRDNRGLTPLHFLLGNAQRPPSPTSVRLLSSTGANLCPDNLGMLPIHYACAFGASEEALQALIDGNYNSITRGDTRGRTPLHFALSNADRPASPAVVRLLLSRRPKAVNIADNSGDLPLRFLAQTAARLSGEKVNERENCEKCLDLYLEAKPRANVDFVTALQALPDWLSDRAVVSPVVQSLLNVKISQRFPTAVLMLDFYFLWIVILTFSVKSLESVNRRFDDDRENSIPASELVPLFLGAGYFFIREVVQVLSLVSLGLFRTWLYDPTNWIDVTFIFLTVYWTIMMLTGDGNAERFRTGTAITLFLFAVNLLSFLKKMLLDFAVFVGGVFYVVKRLVAFLIVLIIILIAFAQAFVTVFQQTSYCTEVLDFNQETSVIESGYELQRVYKPFCGFWSSFIKVYTMLLGEVAETDFEGSQIATFFFFIFMFLVVILLANVLIAIVTDSYGVIRDERAAIVFWSNRLDFIAEMDVIFNAFSCCPGWGGKDEDSSDSPYARDLWRRIWELFEDNPEEPGVGSFDFWCYAVLRVFTACFILFWLLLGIGTAGLLWPPQVRENLFTQKLSKDVQGGLKEAERRERQVKALRTDLRDLQQEIVAKIEANRKDMLVMKSQVVKRRTEIAKEMDDIKQIMAMLFEVQPSANSS